MTAAQIAMVVDPDGVKRLRIATSHNPQNGPE
jgi:hypothetical protein